MRAWCPKLEKEISMNKFTHLMQFVQALFDDADTANKANRIIAGILKAQSPRMRDIARQLCFPKVLANTNYIQVCLYS